jgi:hypothetical protein
VVALHDQEDKMKEKKQMKIYTEEELDKFYKKEGIDVSDIKEHAGSDWPSN